MKVDKYSSNEEDDLGSETGFDKFMDDPGFADGYQTNAPKSFQIKDLNDELLRLYFNNTQTTINELIKTYKEYTQCKIPKGMIICFRDYKSYKLIKGEQTIKNYYVNDNSEIPIFRVCDDPFSQIEIKSDLNKNKKDNYWQRELRLLQAENLGQSCVHIVGFQSDEENQDKVNNSFVKSSGKGNLHSKLFEEKCLLPETSQERHIAPTEERYFVPNIKQTTKSEPQRTIQKSIILYHGLTSKTKISYNKYVNFHVKSLVCSLIHNSRPSYCLKFGEQILRPHQKLDKLQKMKEFKQNDISGEVIKCYDKIIFMSQMVDKDLQISQISLDLSAKKKLDDCRQRVLDRVKDFTFRRGRYDSVKALCGPIQLYSSAYVFRQFNNSLRGLRLCQTDNIKRQKFYNFCSSLTNSLVEFDNYIGVVHRGMKNYRFSKFQKVGDCFCWIAFTSTTKSLKKAEKFKNNRGSLYHINSLTGRDISDFSIFPNEQEVLFLPYTYFITDMIVSHQDYDQVWLSQMPSPQTFSKNIIIWVDDKVEKHHKYIKQIEAERQNVEILQLSSTRMAQYWLKQFSWVLNWKGIQLKVITNMCRKEGENFNIFAGVDILQLFDKKNGVNPQVLIFCQDKEKAEENIRSRKITNKSYFIANTISKLRKFCQF